MKGQLHERQAQRDLYDVSRAAAKAALWREKLEDAVRRAHEGGAPLRTIAKSAGWSHEQVRRVIQR